MNSVNMGQAPAVGIQSVETAAPLLRALVSAGGESTLTALAGAAGMPASKARKYLASLVRTELVAQDGAGSKYRLGPFALTLGLAAMRQIDFLELAQVTLNALRDEFATTASLCVWTEAGPTIVRWAQHTFLAQPIQLGTVLPMLTSAPGLVFAAYLDAARTSRVIDKELKEARRGSDGPRTLKGVSQITAAVREAGLCSLESVVAPGVAVVCAPVFDHMNTIVGAVSVVGVSRRGFDRSPTGPVSRRLLHAVSGLSKALGSTRELGPKSKAAVTIRRQRA